MLNDEKIETEENQIILMLNDELDLYEIENEQPELFLKVL